jgi:Domain of unknown function (DUF4386)
MVKQLERWPALSGIVFVALMLTGAAFVIDVPAADASAQEIAGYLADGENHTRNIIGAYLWVLGGLAFLGFVTGLRTVLRRAEGEPGTLSSLVFGAGVVFTAVWSVSAVALAAVAYAVEFSDAPVTDPDIVRVLPQLGSLLLLVGGGFAGILLVLATSVLAFRTGVLPRWLAWLGILVAIALVFPVAYMNILPLVGWVGVASVVLLVRRGKTAAAAAPGSRHGAGPAPAAPQR